MFVVVVVQMVFVVSHDTRDYVTILTSLGCAPGKCACAGCGKSDAAATTEAKEAAQVTGQQLPAGSV